jgi:predicted TIM-barrel fold metal-dependent hydrolase
MNNRRVHAYFLLATILIIATASYAQDVNELKLKNFRPKSIYKNPQTTITKAKYPAIDMHSHNDPNSDIEQLIKLMDESGIEKKMILTYSTGARFDSIAARYAPYKNRFEVWCGFDYSTLGQPDWPKQAIAELERCYKKGARGVGELGDKGLGEFYSKPVPGWGLHISDPRMKPLLQKCGELKMPISIHVAEDEWMYLPADSTNDGLMNSAKWKVDMSKKDILDHDQLVNTLEQAVRENPKTIFIACHLANCCADLSKLGKMLDKYPNLYADVAARFAEFSPVPRYTRAFMEKYQDRLVYGLDTDGSQLDYEKLLNEVSFRILETADEHFYQFTLFSYHWPLYGLSLSDKALKKIYGDNARKIIGHK